MRVLSKKGCSAFVLFVVLAGVVVYFTLLQPDPPDTRFNGAYRLQDGRLVFITPSEGKILRYRLMSGQSSTMVPVGNDAYESGPGWRQQGPVELQIDFQMPADDGPPTGLIWQPTDGPALQGSRIDLPEIHCPRLQVRCQQLKPFSPEDSKSLAGFPVVNNIQPLVRTHGGAAKGLVVLLANNRMQLLDTRGVTVADDGRQVSLLVDKVGHHGEIRLAPIQHVAQPGNAFRRHRCPPVRRQSTLEHIARTPDTSGTR